MFSFLSIARLQSKYCVIAFLLDLIRLSGCTYQKVNVWQRGHLAKPVMVRDASKSQVVLDQHTYSAKEGTAGGYTAGVGGCN